VVRGSYTSSTRYPWVASAIWGWRFEIGLSVLGFGVLLIVVAMGWLGTSLSLGAAVALAVTRPDLQSELTKRLTLNSDLRIMTNALLRCQIVGRNGTVPKIVKTAPLPIGRRYLAALPAGLYVEALEDRSQELAAALHAREVRILSVPQSAGYAEIVVIRKEAFGAGALRSPLMDGRAYSLWEPIPLGLVEDGREMVMQLAEHNLLIGGEPGSGKSVVLSSIVAAAALDPTTTLTLFDGKQVELSLWKGIADDFVGPDMDDALVVLERLQQIMDFRYQILLAVGRRKFEPQDIEGLHVVVIDELAFYLRGGKKEVRDRFSEALRDLVSRGRAAGIIVVAATQKPSHDVVPTWIRDLFSYRIAMRCTASDASDTILGQGWAARGYSAASIDPGLRGVGFVLAEGGVPVKFKAVYLSDADLLSLAIEAKKLRGVQ
jgi:DNA segregation ATPase FtsK/SpoIIIE-like protein